MSSTYAKSLSDAIESNDNEGAVNLLEQRVREGKATESEKLLCGVLLLMPPVADYEMAARLFDGMLDGARGFEAAVWDAYRFAVLMPDGDRRFETTLRASPRSAIAAHMLSTTAAALGDESRALEENRRSRTLRLFPFNIAEALRRDAALDLDARNDLWRTACDLIVSRSAELDAAIHTIEGALQRRWENLIVGTRLSTPLWNEYSQMFGTS